MNCKANFINILLFCAVCYCLFPDATNATLPDEPTARRWQALEDFVADWSMRVREGFPGDDLETTIMLTHGALSDIKKLGAIPPGRGYRDTFDVIKIEGMHFEPKALGTPGMPKVTIRGRSLKTAKRRATKANAAPFISPVTLRMSNA